MTKESIIELQSLDCNCNDCKFMERRTDLYNEAVAKDKAEQLWLFRRLKALRIWRARGTKNEIRRKEALKVALKLTHTYTPQKTAILYGGCHKFGQLITFIPNILQLHTQKCFEHRRK